MERIKLTKGTSIPVIYDNELKFYLEFFIGMEYLKQTKNSVNKINFFLDKFRKFYSETDIPFYSKHQILIALRNITKYDIGFQYSNMIFERNSFIMITKPETP